MPVTPAGPPVPPTERALHGRNTVIGLVALIVLTTVVVIGMRPLLGGEVVGRGYTYATAVFEDVGTLKPKLQVREDSVVTGRVADTRVEDGRAVVTLRLDGDRPVYRDASAVVLDESALAQKFVDLDRGTPAAGPLGDGVIGIERTRDATNLDDLLNVFDPPTREALRTSLGELGVGLGGRGADLNDGLRAAPALLGDVERITGALAGPAAQTEPLLLAAHRLTGALAGQDRRLADLLRDAEATLDAVRTDGGGPLAATLEAAPETLRDARSAVVALRGPLRDTETATRTLGPGAEALGRSEPDLRGVLREAVIPLERVPDVADDARPALDSLRPALADARPLGGPLRATVRDTAGLLDGLSPYAADVGTFFGQHDLLSGRLSPDEHYFSAMLPFPGLFAIGAPDPVARKDFYPEPGTAGPTRPEGQRPDGGDR